MSELWQNLEKHLLLLGLIINFFYPLNMYLNGYSTFKTSGSYDSYSTAIEVRYLEFYELLIFYLISFGAILFAYYYGKKFIRVKEEFRIEKDE